MKYEFNTSVIKNMSRSYIEIPFNVTEKTGLVGNIKMRVYLNDISFECKLIPKGSGIYYIPVNKSIVKKLDKNINVIIEPIDTLTRINHDSPYTYDNPVRVIDNIKELDSSHGNCAVRCIAMITAQSVENVTSIIGNGHISWSKIKETLDYYKIKYSSKMIYPSNNIDLPKCCIFYSDNKFKLWYGNKCYGSIFNPEDKITCYLELFI